MKPNPDYTRLIKTLWGGQADRVPLLELIVDPEIKSAYLGRPIAGVADDIQFWQQAGYDCAIAYPESPTMWFNLEQERAETVLEDAYTATGRRRWASEGQGLIRDWADLERHPAPTLDQIDFAYFDAASQHLPDGMGLIGAWGDIFTYTWEAMGFEAFCFDFFAMISMPSFLNSLAISSCEAPFLMSIISSSISICWMLHLLLLAAPSIMTLFLSIISTSTHRRRASLPAVFIQTRPISNDAIMNRLYRLLNNCSVYRMREAHDK